MRFYVAFFLGGLGQLGVFSGEVLWYDNESLCLVLVLDLVCFGPLEWLDA